MDRKIRSKIAASSLIMALLAAVMAFGSGQPGVALADDGWVFNPATGHTYRLTEPMTWLEAEAQAQAWGGHLVTLEGAAEEWWLKDTFGRYEHFWIGFSDIAEEGVWVWSSGAPVIYTNWDSGEPNNCCFCTPYPGCEDAAIMNWKHDAGDGDNYGDYWNDLAPDGWARGIVEKSELLANIDINPGKYPNYVSPTSTGGIVVALLTAPGFDALATYPGSARFGPAKAPPWKCGPLDVDGDGDVDLLCVFGIQDSGIACGEPSATLYGVALSGEVFSATDSVLVTGCK